ncbi:unnamed protein product, partial [Rodentolepis nana]|uniref:EF-hand domain-containing protein n=1 Tax=Rodentolepis nana TaxID=102285 RepID=A0A0R3T140_RODNA
MDLFAPLLKLFGPLHGLGGNAGPLQNAIASGLGGALFGRAYEEEPQDLEEKNEQREGTVTGPPQAGGNIGFVPELTSQMASGLLGGGGSSGSGSASGFVETILSMFDSNHDGLLTKNEAKKAASQFDIGSRELK